jgi:uncharacterized phage infection (PIP) family protein YhgE
MSAHDFGTNVSQAVLAVHNVVHSHIQPAVASIEQHLEQERHAVHAALTSIDQAVAHGKTAVHEQSQALIAKMQAIEGDLQQLTHSCHTDLEQLQGAIDHLQQEVQRTMTDSQAAAQQATTAFDTFDQQAQQLTQAAAQQIAEWAHTIDDRVNELSNREGALRQAGHTLETESTNGLHSVSRGLDELAQNSAQQFATLSSEIERSVGQLTINYDQHTLHEIGPETDSSAAEVSSQLDAFRSAADGVESAFDSGIGDVIGKIAQISQILDEIKPVIEVVQTIA